MLERVTGPTCSGLDAVCRFNGLGGRQETGCEVREGEVEAQAPGGGGPVWSKVSPERDVQM